MFIVDVPDPNRKYEWNDIGHFTNKRDALKFIRDNIAPCDDEGNVCLITDTGEPTCAECDEPITLDTAESSYCGSIHTTCLEKHAEHCEVCRQ